MKTIDLEIIRNVDEDVEIFGCWSKIFRKELLKKAAILAIGAPNRKLDVFS
jgi:hypothetical protein